jgi:hypothetical protein
MEGGARGEGILTYEAPKRKRKFRRKEKNFLGGRIEFMERISRSKTSSSYFHVFLSTGDLKSDSHNLTFAVPEVV